MRSLLVQAGLVQLPKMLARARLVHMASSLPRARSVQMSSRLAVWGHMTKIHVRVPLDLWSIAKD